MGSCCRRAAAPRAEAVDVLEPLSPNPGINTNKSTLSLTEDDISMLYGEMKDYVRATHTRHRAWAIERAAETEAREGGGLGGTAD